MGKKLPNSIAWRDFQPSAAWFWRWRNLKDLGRYVYIKIVDQAHGDKAGKKPAISGKQPFVLAGYRWLSSIGSINFSICARVEDLSNIPLERALHQQFMKDFHSNFVIQFWREKSWVMMTAVELAWVCWRWMWIDGIDWGSVHVMEGLFRGFCRLNHECLDESFLPDFQEQCLQWIQQACLGRGTWWRSTQNSERNRSGLGSWHISQPFFVPPDLWCTGLVCFLFFVVSFFPCLSA